MDAAFIRDKNEEDPVTPKGSWPNCVAGMQHSRREIDIETTLHAVHESV